MVSCERRGARVGRGLWVSKKKKEKEARKSLKLARGGGGLGGWLGWVELSCVRGENSSRDIQTTPSTTYLFAHISRHIFQVCR